MPIPVQAWACSFRCGRVRVNRDGVEKHEATCFKNPARRACATCRHDCMEPYEDDTGAGGSFCAVDALPPGKTSMFGCPSWEPNP